MNHEDIIKALCNFTIRVAKGEATPEETAILPEVAQIVLSQASYLGTSPVTM